MIRRFLAEALKRLVAATVCLALLALVGCLVPAVALLAVAVCLAGRFDLVETEAPQAPADEEDQ